ncbi:MAG: HAMP domain-containing histidine kinase [Bacteriovorax sp.]|nr:HAMP domain-containing histidine kinase [Bacteriovorax sp.]
MRFNLANKLAAQSEMWENIFTTRRSFIKKLIVAIMISTIGYSLIYLLYYFTKLYFSSVIEIVVILIVFYSGFLIGLSFAVILSIAADYFFIPPIGSIFDSFEGNERFVIIIAIAIFAASLASTLKSAFQKVALAKKEAEFASTMMEKVLALVAHDIRNPLTTIKMGAQLILKNPEKTDKHQAILKKMVTSIDHADSMIKTLLDTASIRAGKFVSLVFQNCDLNNKVALMIEEMSLILSDNLHFIPSESIWGDWGIDGIHRALENLITNAIKYGTPNTPIEIKLFTENQQAVLSVHNEGNEISPEDQSKLFESFHRTQNAESSTIKGWGLGLSLVKALVTAHGGIAQVESSKGKGSTFTLRLPIQNASQKL